MVKMNDIKPFEKKVWLASPTMHGEELEFVKEAIETNWVSTVGANINELEKLVADYIGVRYGAALSSGTAALHLCMKLAGERLNPGAKPGQTLRGMKVFCSDMTFDASANPVMYEDGEPVFIDTERDTWNMDPVALEKAFELYPDTRLVVLAHLYGVPSRMDEIVQICRKHDAILIEDAAEAVGAVYNGDIVSGKCGTFGDYIAISFNGNKIITGSTGGMFLSNDLSDTDKVRKWSTQSREDAPWYQHEELGYNYRMSNIDAGIARGNMLHISEHIAQKKAIYERYREGLKDLPVSLNPFEEKAEPNYWLTSLLVDKDAMCRQVRGEKEYLYTPEPGKTCPQEILENIFAINAEGRPIWKPMHMQPLYRMKPFVTAKGYGRALTNAYIDEGETEDVGADIFSRGLCLPSDNKMTPDQQDVIIEVIRRCFD
ncbi:MAG: DegT/DnrJ/EryC1/StrS family aminotransferase [Lachnospiraceae bacterium]|nr:DegT/DnrJ/EryC1/StrS family aminotransferase [Lachnospiraceae bacterium]